MWHANPTSKDAIVPTTTAQPCEEDELGGAENVPWDDRDLTSDRDVLLDTLTREQPERLREIFRQLAQS